jgi:hypothetical protein
VTRRDAFVLLLGALLGFAARAIGRSLALDVSRACDPVEPSGLEYLNPNAQRQIDARHGWGS